MTNIRFDSKTAEESVARLAGDLRRPGVRLALLAGAAGTGKTTLVESIVRRLPEEATVGIVDADIGQSHLGPPATIAWGMAGGRAGFRAPDQTNDGQPGSRRLAGWDRVPVESFYFTGAISPAGNLLQLVTGAKLMTDHALAACDKVIVDTTGLVTGSAARALKQAKIDALRPDLIIALERTGELSHILEPFRFLRRPKVIMFPVAPEARDLTPAERADFRRRRFGSYFAAAHTFELSLKHTGLRFTRDHIAGGISGLGPQALKGRLVSLRDEENTDLALGLIEEWGGDGRLLISTPLREPDRVALILVGDLELRA